jgi:hypothetical protein
MKMVVYSGSSYLSHVDTYVEAAGIKHLLQNLYALANHIEMLVTLLTGQQIHAGYMPVRNYHQVTGIIGIAIHNDKVIFSPIQDIV